MTSTLRKEHVVSILRGSAKTPGTVPFLAREKGDCPLPLGFWQSLLEIVRELPFTVVGIEVKPSCTTWIHTY